MAPPEISRRVLEAKLNACRLAFSKLSSVKPTRVKSYTQLRTLLMMKEIARCGANSDSLRDPENAVTRIVCSVLKQAAQNSERALPALHEVCLDNLDDEQKLSVTRMTNGIRHMTSEKYVAGDTSKKYVAGDTQLVLVDRKDPFCIETLVANEENCCGGKMNNNIPEPISWPSEGVMTLQWVENLMETFNWFSWKNSVPEFQSSISHSAVVALIECASKILEKEANCLKIKCCGDRTRAIVVGDLRGHFHDLLKIFNHAGRPSENQFFVFNGNYIGRGSWGLEVFLVLLAWKILMPHRVFLLRGNHETKACSERYGFYKEVCDKFGERGDVIYGACLDCFKVLPLASIIENSVYTTHGGLFRSTDAASEGKKGRISLGSLEELHQLNRKLAGEEESKSVLLNDVLWSDPWIACGLDENDLRGEGLFWGPDCTENFFKQSNLKVIIRSHEGPDARVEREDLGNMLSGYAIDHTVESGKLYTLFSASMYQGVRDYRNEGAYAVLEAPDFSNPQFNSFIVDNTPKHKQASTGAISSAQNSFTVERRFGSKFEDLGIANPPTWAIVLADNAGATPLVQLSEPPEVEGLPLPDSIEEPHKSNYEYLFKLVSALKNEIKTRDDRQSKMMDQMQKMEDALKAIGQVSRSALPQNGGPMGS